eukprot:911621-Pyramimonas_sp.AAC.1
MLLWAPPAGIFRDDPLVVLFLVRTARKVTFGYFPGSESSRAWRGWIGPLVFRRRGSKSILTYPCTQMILCANGFSPAVPPIIIIMIKHVLQGRKGWFNQPKSSEILSSPRPARNTVSPQASRGW